MLTKQKYKKQLKGIIPFKQQSLPEIKQIYFTQFPQQFSKLPFILISTLFLSSTCKLLLPFTLQYLYHRIQQDTFNVSLIIFMSILIGSYFLQMYGEKLMSQYKLNVRKILTQRLIDYALKRNQLQQTNSLWTKITSNINLYVDNYYESLLSLIFQSGKVIFIIIYLLYKLGVALVVGLFLTAAIVHFTLFLSQHIQLNIFKNIKLKQLKVQILREYFSRIIDFKMSWFDEFVGNKIKEIQKVYQKNLRKNKMLDCWCVGLWQFSSIGISSIVLCCFYGFSMGGQGNFQPATIIYLFQMLTFPMNVIAWNINGLKNAHQALKQLKIFYKVNINKVKQLLVNQKQQQLTQSIIISRVLNKKNNDIIQIQKKKIYSIVCSQPNYIKKFALLMSNNTKLKVGYVQQNDWHMLSLLQTLFLKPNVKKNQYQQKQQQIIKYLKYFDCKDIPFQNKVNSYSGGQKMRISLVRAFLLSQVIVIDSDLNSLDQKTRQFVIYNLKQIKQKYNKTIFIKGKFNIADFNIFINQKQQIYQIKQNKNKINKIIEQFQFINKKDTQIIEEKLKEIRQRQYSTNNNSQNNQKNNKNKQENKKVQLSLKTLLYYYKSPKHIIFLISIILMASVSNYYNYDISIHKPNQENINQHILHILLITLIFIIFIYLRSYWFAQANLQQSLRICMQTNNMICYNNIQFYQQNSQQQLTYICVSDEETICNSYSFITNIFFNNLSTVLSCLIMITIQVPYVLLIVILLYALILKIDKQYRVYNQYLKTIQKQQDVNFYKSINYIEQGNITIKIFKHQHYYKQYFQKNFKTVLNYCYGIINLNIWVRKNYRIIMIIFVMFSAILYKIYSIQQNGSYYNQAGLALLIRYLLTFADYIYYFTMSLASCRSSAISIERIRNYVQNKKYKQMYQQRNKKVKQKIQQYKKPQSITNINIEFKNLNFSYENNNNQQQLILKNINLKIKQNDKIILRGKSGTGKTTICKILTQLYNISQQQYINYNNVKISFSSQHPLMLSTASIMQNIDPYQILNNIQKNTKKKIIKIIQPLVNKVQTLKKQLNYQQKILLNNIRTYLYSINGFAIYDQPQKIIDQANGTYLVITHHGKFLSTNQYEIVKGQLQLIDK